MPIFKLFKTDERGGALLSVMFVLVVSSILGSVALNSTNAEIDMANKHRLRVKAQSLAESGARHARKVVNSQGLENFGGLSESLGDGTYSVELKDADTGDKEFRLVSTGESRGVTSSLTMHLDYATADFEADAALSIYTPTPEEFMAKGSSEINGYKHELPFMFECSGASCRGNSSGEAGVPAVYSANGFDMNFGKHTNKSLTPAYNPSGNEDTSKSNNEEWMARADKLSRMASRTITDKTKPWDPLGTREDPQVTVVDGGNLAGNVDGAGVLILKNGAHIAGTFHFEGVVIYKTSEPGSFDLFSSGNNNVFGSLVVTGEHAPKINFTGNSGLKYSEKALEMARKAGATLETVAWQY